MILGKKVSDFVRGQVKRENTLNIMVNVYLLTLFVKQHQTYVM